MAKADKPTAGVLDGWVWNEINSLLLAWFSGLAVHLDMVGTTAVWPRGLLDAYTAMIPKVDGDSTPLGQRPLLCFTCGLSSMGLPQAQSCQGLGPALGLTFCLKSWEWDVVS